MRFLAIHKRKCSQGLKRTLNTGKVVEVREILIAWRPFYNGGKMAEVIFFKMFPVRFI